MCCVSSKLYYFAVRKYDFRYTVRYDMGQSAASTQCESLYVFI